MTLPNNSRSRGQVALCWALSLMTRHPLILIMEAYMYELLDQIRQLEIELAQALNRAKDSVALLEEAVQRLKDHRLELEAGEDRE